MRNYDGSRKWNAIEYDLRKRGYTEQFCCMVGDAIPDDFSYNGRESGWELRRKLKDWCQSRGLRDFIILRNTSFHRDLHGAVYQLWARTAA